LSDIAFSCVFNKEQHFNDEQEKRFRRNAHRLEHSSAQASVAACRIQPLHAYNKIADVPRRRRGALIRQAGRVRFGADRT